MGRATSKLFSNNRTQAVRLPKAVELPPTVREVEITAVGAVRVIAPAGHSWDAFFSGPGVTDDFMTGRDQPAMQDRKQI